MPKSEPRAGIRASTRQTDSRSTASDPRSIQRPEPVMRSSQQPLWSHRRPSTVSLHVRLLGPDRSADSTHPPAATGIWLWFSRPSFCPIARESRGMFGYGRSTGAGDWSVEERQRDPVGAPWKRRKLRTRNCWTNSIGGDNSYLSGARLNSWCTKSSICTVAGWHQRLRSPADLPEEEDPAAMTATLPAMTTMPDIWTTQGDGGGLFDNDHGIAPGSGDFTQLLQF